MLGLKYQVITLATLKLFPRTAASLKLVSLHIVVAYHNVQGSVTIKVLIDS